MLHPWQSQFIEFAIKNQVLTFGEFKLKSGRISPYFFNAGLFSQGKLLSQLGGYYAQALLASQLEFDVLFGPAYKGIPLVCALATALYQLHPDQNWPFSFNRKEA